ncbi:S-adenosyl-L-methionine-dependent methyltransferase [Calocera viscosa TUFC12733]|uniref:S-adenosyl-L-methionine-dependent methyltransferase n=1 Tax=Calocera viscosa (strain TUFC12733) TaxID=1330018 RepID=A0A167G9B0_CALVF|nr:S-adenosyl-L-methionine-dependent methyltransferase [Calocera viscosa TUFC12733]
MDSELDQLDALLALLTQAVRTIKSAYQEAKERIPDLDDPSIQARTPRPNGEEVQQARKIVRGASAQLLAVVEEPEETLIQMANSAFETAALRVAAGACVADHLLDRPEGVHISELSAKCGIAGDKLARILRLLSCKHVFRELQPGVFANTRLSARLSKQHAIWDFVGHMTDEAFRSSAYLFDALTTKPSKTPFAHAYEFDGGYWEYISTVDKAMGERFGRAMMGVGMSEVGPFLSNFPWDTLPEGTTICDVGGGIGTISMALAARFPQLRFVLQEMPGTLEQARRVWGEKAPEAVSGGRVEFRALDFLKEGPKEGCGLYYLKHIIHDWPDEEAVRILKNVRSSMRPKARLLLHEFVMQPLVPSAAEGPDTSNGAHSAQTLTDRAPLPLLSNYGAGGLRGHYADMAMLCMLGSQERTLPEFCALAGRAGLELRRVWRLGGEQRLLEFGLGEGGKEI